MKIYLKTGSSNLEYARRRRKRDMTSKRGIYLVKDNFWMDGIRRKIYGYEIVESTSNSNNSSLDRYRIIVISLFNIFLCLTNLYTIAKTEKIGKIEASSVLSTGLLMIQILMYHNTFTKLNESMSLAIDYLQFMENHLSKYNENIFKKTLINYVIEGGLLSTLITICIALPALTAIFFLFSFTRMYTLLAIEGCIFGPYIAYMLSIRLLFHKNLKIFNFILDQMAEIRKQNGICRKCIRIHTKSYYLCENHLLEFIKIFHTFIIHLYKALFVIDGIVSMAIGMPVLINGPIVVLIEIVQILKTNIDLNRFNILLINIGMVLATVGVLSVFLLSDSINEQITNLNRAIHKVYCKSKKKHLIKDKVITMSFYYLNNKCRFTFGELFNINNNTLLMLINNTTQLAFMLMYLNVDL